MCSIMLACALIPRLALLAALGERREMLGRPVALAPEPDGPQAIGEASGAAEAFGVRPGMRLSEALARCPSLELVPPDAVRTEAVWEATLRRLEGIGAAVEPGRPGEAFFGLEALRGLHGRPEAVLRRARRALGPSGRLGAGPSRLCAHAAARRARARRPPPIVAERAARRFVAGLPVAILRDLLPGEWERLELPETLERLGVRTLGEFVSLPDAAVADRFGEPGLRALRIARGADGPLRPRRPPEELVERLGLPEAASGTQLEHALGLLVDRLLASPARRGRSLRRLRLEARLAGGGGWRAEATLREASADAGRLRLALGPKLEGLPGPALALGLRALELGPASGDQPSLARSPAEERRGRLAEAVRQTRAAAGRDALLRVVEVDPASRVPERRTLLTPFPEPGGERGGER
jgi:nucleotidyltransferase/DNA polymerase involved in DNA repair